MSLIELNSLHSQQTPLILMSFINFEPYILGVIEIVT